MPAERITPTEEAILEQLAVYRFLTPAQLLRLGVTRDRSHLYDTLRRMKRRRPALIDELAFGTVPGQGRLASLYALTPAGAGLLTEHDPRWEGIKAHRHLRVFTNDYRHRVGCVEFHIAFRAWAEAARMKVDLFDAYYDPVPGGGPGRQPHVKTRVALAGGVVAPDAVFAFTDQAGARRLCVFELYNGRRTDRVLDQLLVHLMAIGQGAIETAYRYPHAARVLCLFDDPTGMELVLARARSQPGLMTAQASFFLGTPGTDFRTGWRRLDGTPARLF